MFEYRVPIESFEENKAKIFKFNINSSLEQWKWKERKKGKKLETLQEQKSLVVSVTAFQVIPVSVSASYTAGDWKDIYHVNVQANNQLNEEIDYELTCTETDPDGNSIKYCIKRTSDHPSILNSWFLDLVNLGGGLPPCPRNTRGVPLVQNHLEQLWAILAIKRQAGKDWARWAEPLLFDNPNLYYPKTYVRIYLGDAEYSPECIDMANLYFRAIRSKKKSLRTIKNTSHQLQETQNGVKALLNLIEEIGG